MSPKEDKAVIPEPVEPRPMTIMTEGDAYIAERMKAQPKNLLDIEVGNKEERLGQHRLAP